MPDMDENVIKRVLPHDLETERALLGVLLLYPENISLVGEHVTAEDFYDRRYGMTFDAIMSMHQSGKPVDPLTVHKKLSEMDVPPEMLTLEFIESIQDRAGVSANARAYAENIASDALKRQMIRINEDVASDCYSGKIDIDTIFDETEKKVFKLIQSRRSSDFVPIREVVSGTLAQIEKAARNKGGITGIPTGFIDLDRMTMGLNPSDLVLVAARPAMGKTALVLNMAEYITTKLDKAVAIFSLEMPKEQLIKRMISMNSKVKAENIRSGVLNENEWHDLIRSAGILAGSKLVIDDTSGISISELRSKARRYKLENDIDVIMIDYLQLMSAGRGSKADGRQQEISEISRGLKQIAREINVPVVALSQLSRAVESRSDRRPQLSDLRESGAIEQDADVVMFIYRDEYYNPQSEKKGISEIIIAKQRNGPTGKAELGWIGEYTKFVNLDHSTVNNDSEE